MPDPAAPVGQDRAVDAVRFGIGIRRYGYNIYALGPPGMCKHGLVRQFLEGSAQGAPVPSDWCYLHNFADPQRPLAVQLPAGRGESLRLDMDRLVEELRVSLPAVFESDEYRARRKGIEARSEEQPESRFGAPDKHARERGFGVLRTPMGVALAPLRPDGEVMAPQELENLPDKERGTLEAALAELKDALQEVLAEAPREGRRALQPAPAGRHP